MKILNYSMKEPNSWNLEPISFESVNLVVGRNASGKTRLINTIRNFSEMIINNPNAMLYDGEWNFVFKATPLDSHIYKYSAAIQNKIISKEELFIDDNKILDRNADSCYLNRSSIPKLSNVISAITIFENDSSIKPVMDAFRNIFIRRYNPYASDDTDSLVALNAFKNIAKDDDAFIKYLNNQSTIHPAIGFYYLKERKPEKLNELKNVFKEYFSFIEDIDLLSFDNFPAYNFQSPINTSETFSLCIKEEKKWIPILDISSGMKKYLASLVDLYVTPDDALIMYDEFENGLDPINLPYLSNLFLENKGNRQYIFTSHHPYIINNFPIKSWIVMHRKGFNITNKKGNEIEKDQNIHDTFFSLINDKFFIGEQ